MSPSPVKKSKKSQKHNPLLISSLEGASTREDPAQQSYREPSYRETSYREPYASMNPVLNSAREVAKDSAPKDWMLVSVNSMPFNEKLINRDLLMSSEMPSLATPRKPIPGNHLSIASAVKSGSGAFGSGAIGSGPIGSGAIAKPSIRNPRLAHIAKNDKLKLIDMPQSGQKSPGETHQSSMPATGPG